MLKKSVVALLAVLFALLLCACGDAVDAGDDVSQDIDVSTDAVSSDVLTEENSESEFESENASEDKETFSVVIIADGAEKKVNTAVETVAELLAENEIKLDENDIAEPAVSEKLTDGMQVTVKRVEVKEITQTKEIAFETKKEYSDSMNEGAVKTKVKGVNGIKTLVYSVTYTDGEETDRKLVSETVTKKPVTAVKVYGTKKVSQTTTQAATQVTTTTQPTTEKAETTTATPTTGSQNTRPPVDLSRYPGKTAVSVQAVDDCDGSGHGYYMITFSDGSVEYQDY